MYRKSSGTVLCLLLAATQLLSCVGPRRVWRGKVVGVPRGDTLNVLQGRRLVEVCLHGVGSPDPVRTAGFRAQQLTARLVLGRVVTVEEKGNDKRGRVYGVVKLGTLGLRRVLLYSGLAWHLTHYDNTPELRKLERQAISAGRGLWANR